MQESNQITQKTGASETWKFSHVYINSRLFMRPFILRCTHFLCVQCSSVFIYVCIFDRLCACFCVHFFPSTIHSVFVGSATCFSKKGRENNIECVCFSELYVVKKTIWHISYTRHGQTGKNDEEEEERNSFSLNRVLVRQQRNENFSNYVICAVWCVKSQFSCSQRCNCFFVKENWIFFRENSDFRHIIIMQVLFSDIFTTILPNWWRTGSFRPKYMTERKNWVRIWFKIHCTLPNGRERAQSWFCYSVVGIPLHFRVYSVRVIGWMHICALKWMCGICIHDIGWMNSQLVSPPVHAPFGGCQNAKVCSSKFISG